MPERQARAGEDSAQRGPDRPGIFGIACGHPDCNDAEHLADDPIHKLLLGRDPWRASHWPRSRRCRGSRTQPLGALYDMGCELAARVVERHRRRHGAGSAHHDRLDPTDDPTHAPSSTASSGYDNWCYLPLLAFLTFDREPEQYRVRRCCGTARRSPEGGVAVGTAAPLLCAFPRARFLVRLDGGFASPALRLPGCTAAARLRGGDGEQRRVAAARRAGDGWRGRAASAASRPSISTWTPTMRRARGAPRAGSSSRPKSSVSGTASRGTTRAVVTNIFSLREGLLRPWRRRTGSRNSRTCSSTARAAADWANQLRVFLTAAAYVLMQELRLPRHRVCPNPGDVAALDAQAQRPRRHVRRLVLHLPRSTPNLDAWRKIALTLGARAG